MHSCRGAGFALHFDDVGNRTKDVRSALVRPSIGKFPHGRGGSNGIDRDDFAETMRDRNGGFIAVYRDGLPILVFDLWGDKDGLGLRRFDGDG